MASGAGEAEGVLKGKPDASGSGKHAAEHMTKKPKRYESNDKVRLREDREVFRGQRTQCPPKGETPKAKPGKGKVKAEPDRGTSKGERVR